MTRSKAVALLLICVSLWSTGGFLIKSISCSAFAIAGGRSGLCALILWWVYRPLAFRWDGPQLGAATANALTMFLYIIATKLTAATNAIFLEYMAPVYVAIFSAWYLGEKIRAINWVSLFVAMFGMYLFFKESADFSRNMGNVFAAISGLTFAWTVLFLRKQKDHSVIESLILANALVFVSCSYWVFREIRFDLDLLKIAVLAVFQTTIPNMLYAKIIKNLAAFDIMSIGLLEPILNPTFVFFVQGEQPTHYAVMGGLCIFSVVLLQIKKTN